uniref:Uncharacterized protein n=1 Tax=Venturia canescens TaxID=32260 RepID=A0A0U1ZIE1_9HYME|nr:hypothetical protein [Venturia canescens]
MRECTLSSNEGLPHDAELLMAVNSLMMDAPTAMISDEIAGGVREATEAEISYEQTSSAQTLTTSDYTSMSYCMTLNSVASDKSSAVVERYDGGDSRFSTQHRDRLFLMPESKREKSIAETAGEVGSSLFFDIENFITEDSSHAESTVAPLQSQLSMSEDLSTVVALLKHPTGASDTENNLDSPQQMDLSSTNIMHYKSTPTKILNNIDNEKQKTPAADEQTEVPCVRPSVVAPRKDIKMHFLCKDSYNYNRENDSDNNISNSRGNSESTSTSGGDNSKAENQRIITVREHRKYHIFHDKRIAAIKLSPATMQQENDSEDEENKKSWAPEKKRQSKRIDYGTVQKIAGKFVVRLKDTKDIVDPPKRPVLPKAMTTRVAKLTRRPIVVKSFSLTFPHVTFYDVDDEDDEVSYPKTLNLVALKDLVPEVRLAPSVVGSSLKRYSQKKDTHFIDMHKISNYKTDLMSYPFVYGAVPRAYAFAATYFVNKYLHLFNNARARSTAMVQSTSVGEGQKNSLRKEQLAGEEVPLHDGEIETMTYCYWQLNTQDLINWHDDLPRRRLKQILEYAWVSMRDSVVKECKRDKSNKSELLSVRTSLEAIRKYAEFDKPNRLTAACIFIIKEHYEIIVQACGALNLDPYIWETLMRHCGVHHYLCSHTLMEIAKRMPQVRNVLKYRLLEIEAQASDCVVQPMSSRAVFELFSRWITRPSHVTLKLQQTTNNLFFAECRAFGLHVVRFGIWKSEVIYAEHVVGYADSRKTMMQVLELPQLSHANIKQAINLINDTVNSAVANCGGKMHKLKMSIGARKEFVKYLLYRFSSAIIGVTQCRPKSTTSVEWAALFVEAIEYFMNMNSNHVHHVDEWSLTDDCDLDEYDGFGVLKRSFTDLYDDSDSDGEYDSTCDEGVDEELKELRREYPDFTGKTPAQPLSRPNGISKTIKRHNLIESEIRHKFSDKKISRTKCVLCFSVTTVQTVYLDPGMRVASCIPCHYALNTDPRVDNEALKRRVLDKVKAPIGFTANGMIREFLTQVDETVKARLSYDREKKITEAKRQRAKKLTPSLNSQKRKHTKDSVNVEIKRNKEV